MYCKLAYRCSDENGFGYREPEKHFHTYLYTLFNDEGETFKIEFSNGTELHLQNPTIKVRVNDLEVIGHILGPTGMPLPNRQSHSACVSQRWVFKLNPTDGELREYDAFMKKWNKERERRRKRGW